MYRSVDMSFLQVLLPGAVAEEFADRIAREGCMQFIDLNEGFQPFQRQFTHDIIRIQDIERQIRAIEEMLDDYEIQTDSEVTGIDLDEEKRSATTAQVIETAAKSVQTVYQKLKEQSNVEFRLRNELSSQKNTIRVLEQIERFLQSETQAQRILEQQRIDAHQHVSADGSSPGMQMKTSLLTSRAEPDVGFKYFAGVVTIAQRVAFERQVFLTSRGNSFIQFDDTENELETDEDQNPKIPFVVFFLGDQLKHQLKRLCQFMNIQICYDSDDTRSREELLQDANNKRNDFDRIHTATANQLLRDMRHASKELKSWKIQLIQEKSIRITLNKFRVNSGNSFLTAEGWVPSDDRDRVSAILDEVTKNKGVGRPVVQDATPKGDVPTHFLTNEFTSSFQGIVDTYGVPRYKEFNPAVPTIITFPFLFGTMYGDIFHGSCLFLTSSFFIWNYSWLKESKNEMLMSLVGGRWVIFMMSLFAIYCGCCYNDVGSVMINGWNGSQWGYALVQVGDDENKFDTVMVQNTGTYMFGFDPTYADIDNELTYANSIKMKLSVIIGITQMTFGLILKLTNHIQEGDVISILFEFVPQFIFMMVFFGYMVFIIFYKWALDWRVSTLQQTPSLISLLIKMVLSPGHVTDETQLYDKPTQEMIQLVFIILMVVTIPWMLFPKPFLLKAKHQRQEAARMLAENLDVENPAVNNESGYGVLNEQDEDADERKIDPAEVQHGGHGGGHGHGDEFDFGEIFIHQMIHTIEYVLGTVSNTASYLRLWALSLAHMELSQVFYAKLLEATIDMDFSGTTVVLTVVSQFMFLMATFAVLLVMDVLECFLHALRLHWVEFQNKFYYADGVPFKPYAYKTLLDIDG